MNSNLGEREIEILQFFLKNRDKEFNLNNIFINFDFNSVNLKNSLVKIDNFLITNSLKPLKIHNKNFLLSSSDSEKISSILYQNFCPSKSDRITYLIFRLLTEPMVSLTEISFFFNLNRKSLQLDLQDVKELVKHSNLEIISVNSKGIVLQGDLISKYTLFINLVIRILFKRDNPLQQELYSTICSEKDRDEILLIIQKLSENISFPLTLGVYYAIFSIFLINRKFSDIFPRDLLNIFLKEKNIQILEKSLFNLSEVDVSDVKECHHIIQLIFMKIDPEKSLDYPFFGEKSKEFIQHLEKEVGSLPTKEKTILLNLLEFSVFKKNFMLNFQEDFSFHIDNKFFELLNKIVVDIQLDIYSHDIQKIYFFLKESISLKSYICGSSSPSKILLIDGSMNCWMGKAIKKSILERYYVEEVHVVNYLNLFFKEEIQIEDYPLVLKLEVPPTFFQDSLELNWMAFLRDKDYLDLFNLCKKI